MLFSHGEASDLIQIGAIAAGNAVVVKPSEQTPATSALFAELFPKYLDPDLYHVVNGGVPETTRVRRTRYVYAFTSVTNTWRLAGSRVAVGP